MNVNSKYLRSLSRVLSSNQLGVPIFLPEDKVDLMDMQASGSENSPYNFLLVYQDHLKKFVILCPIKNKTAVEVFSTLLDIFCLIGSPHIYYKVIKKVLGALKILVGISTSPLHNTSPHSTLENASPYRMLFGLEPNKGFEDL